MPCFSSAGWDDPVWRRIESAGHSRVRRGIWRRPRPARTDCAAEITSQRSPSPAACWLPYCFQWPLTAGAEAPDLCVAANSEVEVQHGTAACAADGQASSRRGADSAFVGSPRLLAMQADAPSAAAAPQTAERDRTTSSRREVMSSLSMALARCRLTVWRDR